MKIAQLSNTFPDLYGQAANMSSLTLQGNQGITNQFFNNYNQALDRSLDWRKAQMQNRQARKANELGWANLGANTLLGPGSIGQAGIGSAFYQNPFEDLTGEFSESLMPDSMLSGGGSPLTNQMQAKSLQQNVDPAQDYMNRMRQLSPSFMRLPTPGVF